MNWGKMINFWAKSIEKYEKNLPFDVRSLSFSQIFKKNFLTMNYFSYLRDK